MTDGGLDYTFECIGNIHTMVCSYRCSTTYIQYMYMFMHTLTVTVDYSLCVYCSERRWRPATRAGECPPSLEWRPLARRFPPAPSSWSLAESGRELPSEVHSTCTCTDVCVTAVPRPHDHIWCVVRLEESGFCASAGGGLLEREGQSGRVCHPHHVPG